MTTPKLTLQDVTKNITKVREHKASDFLTDEQIAQVRASNLKGKKNSSFDIVDAYVAEIIARFGYDTYLAWKKGDISEERMAKYVMAERVREVKNRLSIENIIVGAVAGANHPNKSGHAPKTLKATIEFLKNERKFVEGK